MFVITVGPLNDPALRSPPEVFHVTVLVTPAWLMAIMRNTDAGFVGFNPSKNWLVLLMPLPNGSAPGAAAGLVLLPKYLVCHCWNGSTTVSRATLLVTLPNALLMTTE